VFIYIADYKSRKILKQDTYFCSVQTGLQYLSELKQLALNKGNTAMLGSISMIEDELIKISVSSVQ
jgi:hypothetical protein